MDDKGRERLNKIEMKRKRKEESQKGSNASGLQFLLRPHCVHCMDEACCYTSDAFCVLSLCTCMLGTPVSLQNG